MSLRTALEACWDRGVGVLALRDPIAFHGACWRDANRTVIVLKQTSSEESRWLLDLIHEIYHDALLGAERKFMRVAAAETSAERRNSVEERHAQRFAAEVVTNGQAEQLTRRIAEIAGSEGSRLKRATYDVADESGVPVGILANLMAWRLAESGLSWWSVAAGMQPDNEEPWKVIREVLFRRAELTALARHERDFLIQALETPNE
jgi:hypothetical protein